MSRPTVGLVFPAIKIYNCGECQPTTAPNLCTLRYVGYGSMCQVIRHCNTLQVQEQTPLPPVGIGSIIPLVGLGRVFHFRVNKLTDADSQEVESNSRN